MTFEELLKIEISEHAVEKYIERCKLNNISVSENPKKTVRKLLLAAKYEEVNKGQRVHRLIKNRFQPAEYYAVDGWRFVISNNVVVTIERCNPLENNRGIQ